MMDAKAEKFFLGFVCLLVIGLAYLYYADGKCKEKCGIYNSYAAKFQCRCFKTDIGSGYSEEVFP